MNLSLVIDILSIITTSLLSSIAIYISIKVLKTNINFQLISQKANIVMSFDRTRTDMIFKADETIRVSIKNYGNSPGIIKSIHISPCNDVLLKEISNIGLDSESEKWYKRNLLLFNIKDVTLVPHQTLITYLPLDLFQNYPSITILIHYSSLDHDFTFDETFDLEHRRALSFNSPNFTDNITVTSTSESTKTNVTKSTRTDATLKALKFIGESIREVSDKLS